MRRALYAAGIVTTVSAVLVPAAVAAVIQIANSGTIHPPSCPAAPCAVISRTTAVQVTDSDSRDPFVITHAGRITAWSVNLSLPSRTQIHYFDSAEGGTSRAALGVLRAVSGDEYELIAESPVVHLQPDFGRTAELRLARSIPVVKGDLIALIVPTWLPALALNYPSDTSWRASRRASRCRNVALQTAQVVVGSHADYNCVYNTALITYAATETTRH
jgi:hypothetical protein